MANKYKTGFVREYQQVRQQKEEEERIRQKHNITDENIRVVEKSNTLKFIIRILIMTVKTAAWIILIVLAAVGIISLIYPETRNALFTILFGIVDGTRTLLK